MNPPESSDRRSMSSKKILDRRQSCSIRHTTVQGRLPVDTTVTLIEQSFGEHLGPRVIDSLNTVPTSTLKQFAERYLAAAQSRALPAKPAAHLRPFVTYQSQLVAGPQLDESQIRKGDLGSWAELQEALIKKHLLYCHELLIYDPLPYFLDVVVVADTNEAIGSRYIEGIQRYFALLDRMRPLV